MVRDPKAKNVCRHVVFMLLIFIKNCCQSIFIKQVKSLAGLFGEGPADRRGRLKELLVNMGTDAIKKTKEEVQPQKIKTEVGFHC